LRGESPILIGHINLPWLLERLSLDNIEVIFLNGSTPKQEDPELLLSQIPENVKCVVLDGYHFSVECQRAVKQAGFKLLVIDDYNHLPAYDCDILLNQNFRAEELAYHGQIGTRLLGPNYALIRTEFLREKVVQCSRWFPPVAKNLLLTLGGGEFSRHLERLKGYFIGDHLISTKLTVIAGSTDVSVIQKILSNYPGELHIIRSVANVATILSASDLCISAGGSTCWELCCLGIPFFAVSIAENQNEIVQSFQSLNPYLILNEENFVRVLMDPLLRQNLSRVVSEVVTSGLGAQTVADTLIQLTMELEVTEVVLPECNSEYVKRCDFRKRHTRLVSGNCDCFGGDVKPIAPGGQSHSYEVKVSGCCIGYIHFVVRKFNTDISIDICDHVKSFRVFRQILERAIAEFLQQHPDKKIKDFLINKKSPLYTALKRAGYKLNSGAATNRTSNSFHIGKVGE
jgi:spore coat polysaccharide biosynthesis predicted glycosyltransferase SpsG